MWCDVVWCGVVWCDVMWCDVVWYGVVLCCVVLCSVVWCAVFCHAMRAIQYHLYLIGYTICCLNQSSFCSLYLSLPINSINFINLDDIILTSFFLSFISVILTESTCVTNAAWWPSLIWENSSLTADIVITKHGFLRSTYRMPVNCFFKSWWRCVSYPGYLLTDLLLILRFHRYFKVV